MCVWRRGAVQKRQRVAMTKLLFSSFLIMFSCIPFSKHGLLKFMVDRGLLLGEYCIILC